MKCFAIDWKDKRATFAFAVSFYDKEQMSKASDDVIDVLRKRHKLSPLQCAVVLDCLRESLADTMSDFFLKKGGTAP